MSPEEHDVVLGSRLMWLATGSGEPVVKARLALATARRAVGRGTARGDDRPMTDDEK